MGEQLLRDLRDTARKLRAHPSLTLATVTLLAVGIGANTTTFGLVGALLVQRLPYPESESIVTVGQVFRWRAGPAILTGTEFRSLLGEAQSFEHLAAFAPVGMVWNRSDGAAALLGTAVTPSIFSVLRMPPQMGRPFTPADTAAGARQVVLLSHGSWVARFMSDPNVVGATMELNGEPHTVVGVLRDDIRFPHPDVEFWTPFVVHPNDAPENGEAVAQEAVMGVARLRSGATMSEALAEVSTILGRDNSAPRLPIAGNLNPRVVSLREELGRPFRRALGMLAAATALVLLLVCTNVAGLLLAQGISRQQEMAIRRALGARRGRVVRELLVESMVLGVGGGAGGVAVALALTRVMPTLLPADVSVFADVRIDWAVLAFAAGLSVLTSLLFGTIPAVVWSRADTPPSHFGIAPSTGSLEHRWANRGLSTLAVMQVALAVVFLTGAGLLLRSFVAIVTFDRGFDPNGVVVARVEALGSGLPFTQGGQIGPEEVRAMKAAAESSIAGLLARLERIARLPAVRAVAVSDSAPLNRTGPIRRIGVAGRRAPMDPREQLRATVRRVSPGYADVLGLRIQAGRFFARRDTIESPRVAIVSESFARQAFGGEPVLGQRLLIHQVFRFPSSGWDVDHDSGETWEIVGVVGDVRSLRQESLGPPTAGDLYIPMSQAETDPMAVFSQPAVSVRTMGDPLAVVPFLNEVLAEVYPGTPVSATPLETTLSAQATQPRFYAVCASVFGAVALFLAAFGLYGVVSYRVSQRQREVGIRMALGATRRDVFVFVLGQGSALVGVGTVLGLLTAAVMARIIESVLFGITPTDWVTLVIVSGAILTASMVACWFPARRATRTDPMQVLRAS